MRFVIDIQTFPNNIVAALIKNRKRIFEKSQPTLLQREREREGIKENEMKEVSVSSEESASKSCKLLNVTGENSYTFTGGEGLDCGLNISNS